MAVDETIREAGAAGRKVEAVLRHCRRALTWRLLSNRFELVAAGLLAAGLAAVMADHAIPTGLPGVGLVGRLLLLAGVVLGAGVAWRTFRTAWNPVFVARVGERAFGVTHDRLAAIPLLAEDPRSRFAVGAAVLQAQRVLSQGAAAPARLRGDRRIRWLLAAVVLAWVVYGGLSRKSIWTSLARLMGSTAPPATATRIELLRPAHDEVVYANEELLIEVALRGRAAESCWLEILSADAGEGADSTRPRARHSMQRSSEAAPRDTRALVLAPHEATSDLRYCVRAGDGRLDGIIRLQPVPAVTDARIELTPPAYAGAPKVDVDAAHPATVLSGTTGKLTVRANVPMHDAIVVQHAAADGAESRSYLSLDPREPAAGALDLRFDESCVVTVEFNDAWGRRCEPAPRLAVTVLRDQPPVVELVEPDLSLLPGAAIDVREHAWLRCRASDDVRIDTLALLIDRRGLTQRIELENVAGRPRYSAVDVATERLGISLGEALPAYFEATDNRCRADGSPAPQTGRSAVFVLMRTPAPPPTDPAPAGGQPGPVAADAETMAPGSGDAQGAAGSGEGSQRDPDRRSGDPRDAEGDAGAGGQADAGSGASLAESSGAGTSDEKKGTGGRSGATSAEDSGDNGQAQAGEPEGAASGPPTGADDFSEKLKKFIEEFGDDAARVAGDGPPAVGGEQASGSADAKPSGSVRGLPEEGEEPAQAQPAAEPMGEGRSSEDLPSSRPHDAEPAAESTAESRPASRPPDRDNAESRPAASAPGSDASQSTDETAAAAQAAERDLQGTARNQADPQPAAHETEPAKPHADEPPTTQPSDEPATAPAAGAVIPLGRTVRPGTDPTMHQSPDAGSWLLDDAALPDAAPQLLDTLALLERGEPPSHEELVAVGLSPARAERFRMAFQELRDAARGSPLMVQAQRWQARGLSGPEALLRALADAPAAAGLPAGDAAQNPFDGLSPPADQAVDAALRPLLEAYYRAMAKAERE